MTTSQIFRVLSMLGFVALAASSNATALIGCNVASQTNVDCSSIYGATTTEEGDSFFTATDYHVGYRRGLTATSNFMNGSLTVTNHDAFATSVADLAAAVQGSGSTMVVEFDAEVLLSGLVLSGLGDRMQSPRLMSQGGELQTEAAQVIAYNAEGIKIFDQVFESQSGYAYVDFGNIVAQISTLLISSGGGLPGLTPSNNNVAYFITPLPEPTSILLILTGLGLMGLCRRIVQTNFSGLPARK